MLHSDFLKMFVSTPLILPRRSHTQIKYLLALEMLQFSEDVIGGWIPPEINGVLQWASLRDCTLYKEGCPTYHRQPSILQLFHLHNQL